MVTLTLNQEQSDALLSLLDMAVKTGGIQVAEAAVFFAKALKGQIETGPQVGDSTRPHPRPAN